MPLTRSNVAKFPKVHRTHCTYIRASTTCKNMTKPQRKSNFGCIEKQLHLTSINFPTEKLHGIIGTKIHLESPINVNLEWGPRKLQIAEERWKGPGPHEPPGGPTNTLRIDLYGNFQSDVWTVLLSPSPYFPWKISIIFMGHTHTHTHAPIPVMPRVYSPKWNPLYNTLLYCFGYFSLII